MSKFQIAKFIDNNELDLSLQSLTDIPIKEIIKFPKIKSIDLSCNALEQINPNIGQLTNITRLDLSKNKIQSLPSDIGKLVNLEYLDLRSNKLTDLPASMCSLKKLKWLDLKDNPLNVNLGKAAGDCLDRDKCEKCAVNVLEYLSQLMSKAVKKNQKKKRKEDELLRQKAQEEERLRELKKLEKAELRMKRKLEIEEEKLKKISDNLQEKESVSNNSDSNLLKPDISVYQSRKITNFFLPLLIFIFFLLIISGIILLLLGICHNNPSKFSSNIDFICQDANRNLPDSLIYVRDRIQRFMNDNF